MKKRINNKGFTLVELLAVLALLITILSIAIPSITSSVERNKEKLNNKKYDIIEAAAETYVSQYKNVMPNHDGFKNGSCCIDVDTIKAQGILTNDDLLDANDQEIKGHVCLESNNYIYHKLEDNKTTCTN